MTNMYPTLAEEYAYDDGYNDGYYKGYNHAVEKVCELLKNRLPSAMVRSDYYMFNGGFIEDIKKAMEGGEE